MRQNVQSGIQCLSQSNRKYYYLCSTQNTF